MKLLAKYMREYFGFGNPEKAKYWFIGIEDGGGLIRERIQAWEKQECSKFVNDIAQFHDDMNLVNGLDELVPTWDKLIACILAMKGLDGSDFRSRRIFQRKKLARGDNLLAELWPFPFPSRLSELLGENLPDDIDLKVCRGNYSSSFTEERVKQIKQLVGNYKPQIVVVYGSEPCRHIFGDNLEEFYNNGAFRCKKMQSNNTNTAWIAVPHPNARGTHVNNWIDLGERLIQFMY